MKKSRVALLNYYRDTTTSAPKNEVKEFDLRAGHIFADETYDAEETDFEILEPETGLEVSSSLLSSPTSPENTLEELSRKAESRLNYEWKKGKKDIQREKQVDQSDLTTDFREEDPMAGLLKTLPKHSRQDTDTRKYKGPMISENRFNILPGFRWDGIDRSNGFEKKYMHFQNSKSAEKLESYRNEVNDF